MGAGRSRKNEKTINTMRRRKMLAKGAPRNAPSENTLPPLVSTKKHPWAQRGQTHRNTKKGNPEETRTSGRRTGASDERFEGRRPGCVRRRNLDKKASKRGRKRLGAQRSRKNIKTRNTERGRKMLARGAPRRAPFENTASSSKMQFERRKTCPSKRAEKQEKGKIPRVEGFGSEDRGLR